MVMPQVSRTWLAQASKLLLLVLVALVLEALAVHPPRLSLFGERYADLAASRIAEAAPVLLFSAVFGSAVSVAGLLAALAALGGVGPHQVIAAAAGLGVAAVATGIHEPPLPAMRRHFLGYIAVSALLSGAALGVLVSAVLETPPSTWLLYVSGVAVSMALALLLYELASPAAALLLGIVSGFSWLAVPILLAARSAFDYPPREEGALKLGVSLAKAVRRLRLRRTPRWSWLPLYPRPLGLDPAKLNNMHVLVVGMSGSGKSTLAKNMVKAAARQGINVLVIDFHGEYGDVVRSIGGQVLDASQASINILELDGASPRERASEVADLIQTALGLGNLQRVMLEQAIEEAYMEKGIVHEKPSTWGREPPTLLSVATLVRRWASQATSRSEQARLNSLAMYLDLLAKTFHSQTSISMESLLSNPTSVMLNTLPGDHVRVIYAETLLRKIAANMYRSAPPRPLLIVVEEAHRLSRRSRTRRSLLARLLAESRKYNIGFVAISQQPLDLEEAVVANCAVRAVFTLQEPRNLDYAVRLLGGAADPGMAALLRETIRTLHRGNAVVSVGSALYLVSTTQERYG